MRIGTQSNPRVTLCFSLWGDGWKASKFISFQSIFFKVLNQERFFFPNILSNSFHDTKYRNSQRLSRNLFNLGCSSLSWAETAKVTSNTFTELQTPFSYSSLLKKKKKNLLISKKNFE